ncbi:(2,3-dihydroxybenzoyl)adenylate synthase [Actinoplanes sp. NPDC049599]|uniref:(2,3-dihydroxybenzoyl)adenylate synthase n=1 Tax=Actinoplanes sp. NPDC049599 TaxID=3363903 RepID=UPI0037A63C84
MTSDVVPWPADLAHAYRTAGCWRGEPLGAQLWQWADDHPDRVAVTDETRRLTYRELAVLADRLAEGLDGLGLRRGDSVLVQLPNGWEFVVVLLACLRAGVAPVMMLPPHRENELGAIGSHVDARAVIVPGTWRGYDHEGLAHRVLPRLAGGARVLVCGEPRRQASVRLGDLLEPGPADDVPRRRERLDACAPTGADVAVFLLSGGTTAVPKVIARTHDDYEYNIRCVVAACGFDARTVYLAALPAGHNFPLANPGILGTLVAGGRVVLVGSPRPEAVFAAVEAERVTVTAAVPAVVLRWMDAAATTRHDLSSLRHVQVGGSMLSPDVAARIRPALGCGLQQVYGMAEGLICYTRPDAADEVATTTQGAPISPYDELLVVDRDGTPVPPGGIGELLTRGPYTPRGYYRAAQQNAVSFTPDGWYRTGDLVRITAAGHVVVCGRVKDLINRGGEKISAGEIEQLLQELPEVAEAAAVAMPDPAVGERVCAVVRLHPERSLTLPDVRAFFAARGVAAFKAPEHLVVVDQLPHTPVGKPDKTRLRALVNASFSDA